MENKNNTIQARKKIFIVLKKLGIPLFGVCSFEKLEQDLISCRAKSRLPQHAKSVICMLFPYRVEIKKRNLSRYAVIRDYHDVVMGYLKKACSSLQKEYPNSQFVPFCDNSPIPEKKAAILSGLGVIGDNQLLINQEYGSYVFIGEIVTDLLIQADDAEAKGCLHCGACGKSCPTGALLEDGFQKENCLSFLTQKKKELTYQEEQWIKKGGSIWGCDICQDCCPFNQTAKTTKIKEFLEGLHPIIKIGDYDRLQNRAFAWRPKTVIERNLRILAQKSEDTSKGNK